MPWCPKCKTEYREGFNICSNCNETLVDELPQITENIRTFSGEAFLMSVPNDSEADVYVSLLEAYDIPVLRRPKVAGDYLQIYMGNTNLGIDLYVPSELLGEAKEIVQNRQQSFDDFPESEDIPLELEKTYKSKQRIKAWIIFIIFIPGILWMIFGFIVVMYQIISNLL